MTRYVEYRYFFVFSAGLFLGVPQKGRRKEKQLLSRRTQHHISTAAKAFDASSSNSQTRSIGNTGRPRRRAALLTKAPFL